jgi:hypothetical protein
MLFCEDHWNRTAYFLTLVNSEKNPNLCILLEGLGMENVGTFFGSLVSFLTIWYNIRPFGTVWEFGSIWYVYFSRFGMFVPRKIWQPCRLPRRRRLWRLWRVAGASRSSRRRRRRPRRRRPRSCGSGRWRIRRCEATTAAAAPTDSRETAAPRSPDNLKKPTTILFTFLWN